MVEGAGSHKLHIGADAVGGGRCQVAHGHRVLERAGTLFGKLAEHGIVYVGKLHKGDLGGEAEGFFKYEYHDVGKRYAYGVDGEEAECARHECLDVSGLEKVNRNVSDGVCQEYHQSRAEQLRTPGKLAYGGKGSYACHELKGHELEHEARAECRQEDGDKIGEEGRAGVEEHQQKYRYDCERYEV